MAAQDRMEQLTALPQSDYEELLANLIVKYYKPGFLEIILNLNDKNRISLMRFIVMLNAKFKETGRVVPLLKFSGETATIAGGFYLTDGKEKIDCTFESLLEQGEALLLLQ